MNTGPAVHHYTIYAWELIYFALTHLLDCAGIMLQSEMPILRKLRIKSPKTLLK